MVKLDKAFKIKNFLDNKEIKIIENIVKKIPKQIPTYNHDAYTNGFDYKFIKKFIDKKLKKIFNFFNIKDCVFLEEFVPWDIHTDYDKGDSNPYYACLIPLDYENKITHTVIFNEIAKSKKDIDLLPVSKVPLDKNILSIIDHCSSKKLEKVSLFSSYKWEQGALIAWHRTLLHTSDNFIKNGMKCKRALVLFLNQDTKENNG